MAVHCRRLEEADAPAFRALRLESLANHPEAFGSTYAQQAAKNLADYAQMLANGCWFGAYEDEILVGMVAFVRSEEAKGRHRGFVYAVYVSPEHRGRGIARALMQALETHARRLVRQLHLTVMVNNADALKLYSGLGYERYGTDPRLIELAGAFLDAYLMVKLLDQTAPTQDEEQ